MQKFSVLCYAACLISDLLMHVMACKNLRYLVRAQSFLQLNLCAFPSAVFCFAWTDRFMSFAHRDLSFTS